MAVKLSREEQYGIIALIDLTHNLEGGPAQVRQIAVRQNIPQRFLEQIFAKLRQANIVVGKRGPQGGYSLARKSSEIKMDEVMKALRPKLKKERPECAQGLLEVVESFWSEIEERFYSSLHSMPLDDLCARVGHSSNLHVEVTKVASEPEVQTSKFESTETHTRLNN